MPLRVRDLAEVGCHTSTASLSASLRAFQPRTTAFNLHTPDGRRLSGTASRFIALSVLTIPRRPLRKTHTVFDLHSPCRPCPRWPWQAACACPSDAHLFQHLRHRMPSWGLHVQLSSFGILTTCSSNSLQLRRRLFLSTQINSINFVMRCTATSIHALHRPSLYS